MSQHTDLMTRNLPTGLHGACSSSVPCIPNKCFNFHTTPKILQFVYGRAHLCIKKPHYKEGNVATAWLLVGRWKVSCQVLLECEVEHDEAVECEGLRDAVDGG